MFNELKINGTMLPLPDGDLSFSAEKIKTQGESEAGTSLVIVRRNAKLTISGTWTLTGEWMARFRSYRDADTVTVSCFYPNIGIMTDHECQFEIVSEEHVRKSRSQLGCQGLYKVEVDILEI